MRFRDGLVTRGVLIDWPRFRNVPYMGDDEAICAEDLLGSDVVQDVRPSRIHGVNQPIHRCGSCGAIEALDFLYEDRAVACPRRDGFAFNPLAIF